MSENGRDIYVYIYIWGGIAEFILKYTKSFKKIKTLLLKYNKLIHVFKPLSTKPLHKWKEPINYRIHSIQQPFYVKVCHRILGSTL